MDWTGVAVRAVEHLDLQGYLAETVPCYSVRGCQHLAWSHESCDAIPRPDTRAQRDGGCRLHWSPGDTVDKRAGSTSDTPPSSPLAIRDVPIPRGGGHLAIGADGEDVSLSGSRATAATADEENATRSLTRQPAAPGAVRRTELPRGRVDAVRSNHEHVQLVRMPRDGSDRRTDRRLASRDSPPSPPRTVRNIPVPGCGRDGAMGPDHEDVELVRVTRDCGDIRARESTPCP